MVHPRCARTWRAKDQLITMAVDKALSDGRSFGDFALTVLLAMEYPWIQNTIRQTGDQIAVKYCNRLLSENMFLIYMFHSRYWHL